MVVIAVCRGEPCLMTVYGPADVNTDIILGAVHVL